MRFRRIIPILAIATAALALLSCKGKSQSREKTLADDGGTVLTVKMITDDSEADFDKAFLSARTVLGNRLERLGVNRYSISTPDEEGCFQVELPGVFDSDDRIKKVLWTGGKLEFWETYNGSDIRREFAAADRFLHDFLHDHMWDPSDPDNREPLSSLLITEGASGACIGYAVADDTLRISLYISIIQAENAVDWPEDFRASWTFKSEPLPYDESREGCALIAIKTGDKGVAPLDGRSITNATPETRGEHNFVSLSFNAEGTRLWADLTGRNTPVNRFDNGTSGQIAITIDGLVYTYPIVIEAITGGRAEISGEFTLEEAQDLANVFLSGTLPVPVKIVGIQTFPAKQ